MRVIVCGGRDFKDPKQVWNGLTAFHSVNPISQLITGGCPTGVDSFAKFWAKLNAIPLHVERAKWELYGPAAGPIRNGVMANMKPDAVIAFPGGDGTANMVKIAQKNNIPVHFQMVAEPGQYGVEMSK